MFSRPSLKRGDLELICNESEAEAGIAGCCIKNVYEGRTHDYDIRLEIKGYGSTMEQAEKDLNSKIDAFEGKTKRRVKPPTTGAKPRKMPF